MEGTVAKPSSPSVRFTALLKPTIKKYVTTTWNMPSGIARSLKYGISNDVCTSSVAETASSTIGHEKDANPVLAHATAASFVNEALTGLQPYPDY